MLYVKWSFIPLYFLVLAAQVYNYEGPLISTIKGEAGLTEPTGIVTDDQGHCYICYPQQQCIKKYLYTNAAPPETPKMVTQMSMTMISNGEAAMAGTNVCVCQYANDHDHDKQQRGCHVWFGCVCVCVCVCHCGSCKPPGRFSHYYGFLVSLV